MALRVLNNKLFFGFGVRYLKSIITLLIVMALGACVSSSPSIVDTAPTATSTTSAPHSVPPTVVTGSVEPNANDRVIVDGNVLPLPEERTIATASLPQERPVSPVVNNLIKKAQGQSREGDFDSAANSLERALRIEPRNAMLWNRLADVRYLQELWKKSIQLAAKSNTLAGSDRELRRENWYLMSNSYKALGNVAEEQKYRDKLIRQSN